MSRLTRKLNKPYEKVMNKDYVYTSDTRLTPSFASVEQKLGQLEDIEDELSIDLEIISKVLKQGLYLKRENDETIYYAKPKDIIRCDIVKKYIEIDNFSELGTTIANDYLFFEDYGKTWALTKEELKND